MPTATCRRSVINTNLNGGLVIYYSQAVAGTTHVGGREIKSQEHDHLRWVTNHAGYFSSTNVTFGDGNDFILQRRAGAKLQWQNRAVRHINPTNLIFTITMTNKPVPASLLQLAEGYARGQLRHQLRLLQDQFNNGQHG